MNYKELYERMAIDAKITPKQVEKVLYTFATILMKQLKMGRRVVATNFGTFFMENGNVHFKTSKWLRTLLGNQNVRFKPSKALINIVKPNPPL